MKQVPKVGATVNMNPAPRTNNQKGFDPDFQLWLDVGRSLQYALPSHEQQLLLNTFVINLKKNGLWGKFDILYFFAINDSKEQAALNFIKPLLYACTINGGMQFDVNQGFLSGNGKFLDTNFNPSSHGENYTLDDASRILYLYSQPTSPFQLFIDGTSALSTDNMQARSANSHRINQSGNNLSAAVDLTGV